MRSLSVDLIIFLLHDLSHPLELDIQGILPITLTLCSFEYLS
jgi:hypothetical protein